MNFYNPYPPITIGIYNKFGDIEERFKSTMRMIKKPTSEEGRIYQIMFLIEGELSQMEKFWTLDKHLKIDSQTIGKVLEGKMDPTENYLLFSHESAPGDNLDNEIDQLTNYATFKIKVRNVYNKLQDSQSILKLLIIYIRRRGKLKIPRVIEEFWKRIGEYFIRSLCYTQQFSFSLIGKIKPNIINHFSQDDRRRVNSNLKLELFKVQKLMLTVSLNKNMQLLFWWTSLGYAIQTLIFTLIFLGGYKLLYDQSWHATQCNFPFLRLVKHYEILQKINRQENDCYLDEDIHKQQNQRFDVAAGSYLNIRSITGAQKVIVFEKVLISICVVFQIKLAVLLIQHVQLKTGWTNLVHAIQTLLSICLFIINQFLDSSWLGTQSNSENLFYRSRHSKAYKPTSQQAETQPDLILQLVDYLSHSEMVGTHDFRIQRGQCDLSPAQLKPLAAIPLPASPPGWSLIRWHPSYAPNF
jgi:hypothetical protein